MADIRAQHTPVGRGTEGADVPGMRCCGSCSGADGAARCDGVALVLMQADRVSPARTRAAAESTSGPIVAAVSTDIDGAGCICVEPALCRYGMRYCLTAAAERRRMADIRAQHTPVGRGTAEADVPAMRWYGSCFGANGAARCDGVALVVVQADRVSPARTRTAAESTAGPIVAAASTDYDGNGCYLRRACPVPMRYALHVLARSGIRAASSLLLCPHRPPMSVSQSGCFAFACARADCLHAQVLRTWCHSSCMCVPTARELPMCCQCSRTRACAQQAHHASRSWHCRG